MGLDYSFIRLKPTFEQATQLGDNWQSIKNKLAYHNVIQLLPNETYLQISNVSTGIAFDGDVKVEVINCDQEVIYNITNSVFISEFVDVNGINQIAFELVNLTINCYNEPVFLKFSKTTGSDVWFSNPILITDDSENETTRFDYKSYKQFHGIDYQRADFMQSIRLKCWYDRPSDETEIKDYYQITNGNTISTRALLKETEIYKFDYVNPFVFKASNILMIHDIIYIDGVRMTNKTTLKSSDRLGQSNLMETEFIVNKNHSDTFTPAYQLFEPLALTFKAPSGSYDINNIPYFLQGDFNKNITINTGIVTIYNDNGTVFHVFDNTQLEQPNPLSFAVEINGLNFIDSSYYVNISQGLITSGTETFTGISNDTDFVFSVVDSGFVITSITGAYDVNFTVIAAITNVLGRYKLASNPTWTEVGELFTEVSPATFAIPLTGLIDVQLYTLDGIYSNIYQITI